MKEFKHFNLKATRRPAKPRNGLSTTVAVRNEQGEAGYCYVSFSDTFIAAVGKKLPRGVSEFEPAFLVAYPVGTPPNERWQIGACYASDIDSPVQLWTSKDKPGWLNFYKIKGNKTKRTQRHDPDQAPQGTPGDNPRPLLGPGEGRDPKPGS